MVTPALEKNMLRTVSPLHSQDITNSAAVEIEDCPIAGMPVVEVWRAKKCIYCKRSMAGGYADIDNPVFYKDNTEMLLGDAKATAEGMSAKLKEFLSRSGALDPFMLGHFTECSGRESWFDCCRGMHGWESKNSERAVLGSARHVRRQITRKSAPCFLCQEPRSPLGVPHRFRG